MTHLYWAREDSVKYRDKAITRLEARRKAAGKIEPGKKLPGSLNRRKSYSIKGQRRGAHR